MSDIGFIYGALRVYVLCIRENDLYNDTVQASRGIAEV